MRYHDHYCCSMATVADLHTTNGLRAFLARNGLTQRNLADAAGVTDGAVSQVLCGRHCLRKQTIDKVLAFARKFEPSVTYEQLFGGSGG